MNGSSRDFLGIKDESVLYELLELWRIPEVIGSIAWTRSVFGNPKSQPENRTPFVTGGSYRDEVHGGRVSRDGRDAVQTNPGPYGRSVSRRGGTVLIGLMGGDSLNGNQDVIPFDRSSYKDAVVEVADPMPPSRRIREVGRGIANSRLGNVVVGTTARVKKYRSERFFRPYQVGWTGDRYHIDPCSPGADDDECRTVSLVDTKNRNRSVARTVIIDNESFDYGSVGRFDFQ
jgi:hypothetical protein